MIDDNFELSMKDSYRGFSKNYLERAKRFNDWKYREYHENDVALCPSLCMQGSSAISSYLPSDVPGRRALFHHGSIGTHVEYVL